LATEVGYPQANSAQFAEVCNQQLSRPCRFTVQNAHKLFARKADQNRKKFLAPVPTGDLSPFRSSVQKRGHRNAIFLLRLLCIKAAGREDRQQGKEFRPHNSGSGFATHSSEIQQPHGISERMSFQLNVAFLRICRDAQFLRHKPHQFFCFLTVTALSAQYYTPEATGLCRPDFVFHFCTRSATLLFPLPLTHTACFGLTGRQVVRLRKLLFCGEPYRAADMQVFHLSVLTVELLLECQHCQYY
jgi:hypothetical protein